MEQKIKTVTDMDGIIINGVYYAVMDVKSGNPRCEGCDLKKPCDKYKFSAYPCLAFGNSLKERPGHLKRIGKVNAAKLQEAIEK